VSEAVVDNKNADNPISDFQSQLSQAGYIADRSLAASLMLFNKLQRPLLLEGDAGVGKTEIAKVLSSIYDCDLIRLQCYEGLDVNSAVYEWNYQQQLLSIKLLEQSNVSQQQAEKHIFDRQFLLERPLLSAITQNKPPVLLVDEIDRADEEFEAFLLEVLSDFQISIPELGTIKAVTKPLVILTANGTRELSDALRRRCLYHYVDYPEFDKELRIVNTKIPDMSVKLARQIVGFVQDLRNVDLRKKPGVAETLDWASALLQFDITSLDDNPELLMETLGCLLKTHEDSIRLETFEVERLIARAV
jgi:MoxR-like ATPase